MARLLPILLAVLLLLSTAPARDLPVAPLPRAVAPQVAVAPLPHTPGEPGLTLEDPGLDPKIEAALPEIERAPAVKVPGAVDPKDPIGLPDPPRFDPKAGLRLPAAPADDPFGPGRLGGRVELPPGGSFAGRAGATRTKLLKEYGGNAESERAVALGLAWLARQQKADGSWQFDQGSKEKAVAATGLALLPFLGAGETHKARDKEKDGEKADGRKYAKTVAAGVGYLMKLCPVNGANAGRISTDMYEQGIATLALCEAYGMTRDPDLKPCAQAAINYLMKAQGPNGSWGYGAGSNGDTSIVGWQVQALFAARQSKDLVVDDRVIKRAIKFLDSASAGSRKAEYGYMDNSGAKPGTALTASGLWSRACIDNWGPNHPGMAEGVAGLMKSPPASTDRLKNLYYFHYATQVVRATGGEEWRTWNEGAKQADGTRKGGMRDWLVKEQVRKDGEKLGSWDPEAGWFGSSCGRLGTTAVCLLQLEVSYRYLPQYKVREEKKDDK